MARITASQISLLKQLFTQLGSSIEVDQVNGADNWFVSFFNALGPSLVTQQGTAAAAAASSAQASAAAAQSTADAAVSNLQTELDRRTANSGSLVLAADQELGALPEDLVGMEVSLTLTSPAVIIFSAVVATYLVATESATCWLNVDGVNRPEVLATYANAVVIVGAPQTWRVELAEGSHIVKLVAAGSAGTPQINKDTTTLTWWQV